MTLRPGNPSSFAPRLGYTATGIPNPGRDRSTTAEQWAGCAVSLLTDAFSVLDEAYEQGPKAVFALFSGGHDSLTATAVVFEWAGARGVDAYAAHINTGTGIPQTSAFVRDTCAKTGWPLTELHPPVSYEDLVKEYGFPGPPQHGFMYQRLKERCLYQLVREAPNRKRGELVMLCSGRRSDESVRRMRTTKRIERDPNSNTWLWANPIWNWTKLDCQEFFIDRGFDRNPVVDMLHMSGECLCGAFAKPGEIKELELWIPDKAAEIHRLESEAEALGLRACRWGQRIPNVHREQMKLEVGPLCQGCVLEDVA